MAIENIPNLTNWEDLTTFLKDNKSQLAQIKDTELEGSYLGKGEFGYVFKIKGTDTALKITTDTEEVELAETRVGKKTRALVAIHEIESLEYNNKEVGVIIIDLLKPGRLSSIQIREIGKLRYMSNSSRAEFTQIVLNEEWSEEVGSLVDRLVIDLATFKLDPEDLDIHPDNVMQDADKKLMLIDN